LKIYENHLSNQKRRKIIWSRDFESKLILNHPFYIIDKKKKGDNG